MVTLFCIVDLNVCCCQQPAALTWESNSASSLVLLLR